MPAATLNTEAVFCEQLPLRILHADGSIELNANLQPTYYYHLKDHLGNVRAVVSPTVTNSLEVLQTNDYYPFGMSMSKNSTTTPYNKYKYNGKEEQEMPGKWLDYGARMYDAQLGRWHSVDPLCEEGGQESWAPYHYVYNNPIKNTDPDGRIALIDNLIGGVVGGCVEIGTQMVANAISGEEVTNISWGKVGIAAAEGFVTSGASTAVKVAANIGAAIAISAIDNSHKGIAEVAKGTVVNLGIGAVSSGTSKLAKGVAKETLTNTANKVINSKTSIAKGIKAVTNVDSKTAQKVATHIQSAEKVVAKEVRKANQTVVKTATGGAVTAITDDKSKK
jgi:RHS repeat-associated protein